MTPLENLPDVPTIWEGNQFVDDRGSVSFVNKFNLYRCGVERVYWVQNVRSGYIRGLHGHKREGKFVLVVQGMALVNAVQLDEADNSILDGTPVSVHSFVLCGWQPKILFIPPGYYNGFKSLKESTTVMFFSTSDLGSSEKRDDFRLAWDALGTEIWNEHFR